VGVKGLPWEWIPPALALLLPLALLGWVVARRRRNKEQLAGDVAPELAPLEELLAALERINAAVGQEPAVLTCDRLAASMRRFLERRVGEPAQEMTSFELFRMVRRGLQADNRCRFPESRLPPEYKGAAGGCDTGYGVYDLNDLGEFNQQCGAPHQTGMSRCQNKRWR